MKFCTDAFFYETFCLKINCSLQSMTEYFAKIKTGHSGKTGQDQKILTSAFA